MKTLILSILVAFSTLIYSQADCPAQFVCSSLTNATVTVGSINELNGSNRGCLTSNEASASHWYRICALTAGTIQFTIAPNGSNNDYDFAVWSGSNCPPTTAPIRCSYALSSPGPGGDNTGVNSINNAPQTDNSEGVFGNQWVQDIIATPGQCFIICVNNYGTGSNIFNLTFGGTATLDCLALPIELLSFSCESKENGVELNWSTATETNNDYFILERSYNGVNFERISIIEGMGTTSIQHDYSYTDLYPYEGVTYYRLSQVDFDGHREYFNIVSCTFSYKGVIAPMNIYDLSGRLVFSKNIDISNYRWEIDNANISNGMYTIQIIQNNRIFLIQKHIKVQN